MNNTKIKNWLVEGKSEKAFTKLYQLYPKVEKYILQNSGSKDEALDIFQEGLILLYHKINKDKSIVIDGFLIQSCKFLWQNELRKKKIRHSNGDVNIQTQNPNIELDELIEKENQLKKLELIIKQISKKCQEIFQLFYFKSFSMTEIAKKIGYKSVQSAKVQKYKCMEKARNLALETTQQKSNIKY